MQNGEVGLSIDQARTMFHEFGHALHALLSNVRYPSQAGTAVARDFVEFPSKFMEHWIVAKETLEEQGLPEPLIAAIGRADGFGQGYSTVEFVASAIIDLALHRSEDERPDAKTLSAQIFEEAGMPANIAPRHGLAHFTHVFDGGYDARIIAIYGPRCWMPTRSKLLRKQATSSTLSSRSDSVAKF